MHTVIEEQNRADTDHFRAKLAAKVEQCEREITEARDGQPRERARARWRQEAITMTETGAGYRLPPERRHELDRAAQEIKRLASPPQDPRSQEQMIIIPNR